MFSLNKFAKSIKEWKLKDDSYFFLSLIRVCFFNKLNTKENQKYQWTSKKKGKH